MSRKASRSALDPSPSVIRPATSTTLTSPTCRVFNFTLTNMPPGCLPPNLLRTRVFDQGNFHSAALMATNIELVHKRADQKNSAPRSAHQVFRRQRVGQALHVEPLALIRNPHRETLRVVAHREPHLLVRVVPVPVHHRVDHRFPHGHPDLH